MDNLHNDFYFSIEDIITVHEYTFKTNAVYDFSSKRKLYGLVYILDGELEYTFSEQEKTIVCKGDTFLLTPESAYSARYIQQCKHYTVNFTIQAQKNSGDSINSIFNNTGITRALTNSVALKSLFEKLSATWSKKGSGYRVMAKSLLYELLFHFVNSSKPRELLNIHTRLFPSIEHIEKHWAEDFSVSYLASLCCLSTSYFRHLFVSSYDRTPIGYRNHLRILHAKDLLSQDFYTVSEVAFACGFDDANYFSRFFKKETGLTPTEYLSVLR